MVKRPYLLLLIFLVTLTLVTCKKDDDGNKGGKKGDNSPEDHSQTVGSSEDHSSAVGSSEAHSKAVGSSEDHSKAVGSSEGHQSEEEKPNEETSPKKRKKPVAEPTCEELLQETKKECYQTVPAGYDPDSCKFNFVENEDCDWEFICESTLPVESEEKTTTTEGPESSSSSVESCETDRKISFNNCFINVDGFVKHSRAKLCDN